MKWEELTARDFPKAVRKAKSVCLVPLGCIEKHGDHLPLGTDILNIRAIAETAVTKEPAVIFPWYFFTQIHCAKHQPGTIAIRERLMFDLLENTCEEIARNGLKKILLLNGHGGNEAFLQYFSWIMTHQDKRDFTVYVARLQDFWSATPKFKKLKETDSDGHGGEKETSLVLSTYPDLTKPTDIPVKGAKALGRTAHLPMYTPMWWYGDYPDHYAGDAKTATKEKGDILRKELGGNVARLIKAVKDDTAAPRLMREFHRRTQHGRSRTRKSQ